MHVEERERGERKNKLKEREEDSLYLGHFFHNLTIGDGVNTTSW